MPETLTAYKSALRAYLAAVEVRPQPPRKAFDVYAWLGMDRNGQLRR
ncbi:hypothetical protein PQU92_17490 [Asticcacaulis sp. BYS171W]|uniref:Integrase n=1 Tax=Asticcacaulis aquaticus TaxID=2984212 RepID=A0ABT5HYC1_9CAUL|nr:hypothetical protein [Asticcacaulis aquaticus]MDC7685082.1 hypothetical protein [Asticcacaulis aquaticus]